MPCASKKCCSLFWAPLFVVKLLSRSEQFFWRATRHQRTATRHLSRSYYVKIGPVWGYVLKIASYVKKEVASGSINACDVIVIDTIELYDESLKHVCVSSDQRLLYSYWTGHDENVRACSYQGRPMVKLNITAIKETNPGWKHICYLKLKYRYDFIPLVLKY